MRHHCAIVLLTASIVGAAGCTETGGERSITGVEARDDGILRAVILGPNLVATPGFYEWTAHVNGGAADVTYEWSVDGIEPMTPLSASDDARLTLGFDDLQNGAFEIQLVVRRGDQTVLVTERVDMCPQRDPVDWCFPDYVIEPMPTPPLRDRRISR